MDKPATFLFTSEAVCEGHPDKLCDQISDTVLDAIMREDKSGKCACEAAVKDNNVIILGEISTTAKPDFEQLIRELIRKVGFDDEAKGMDGSTAKFLSFLSNQSSDIAEAVHVDRKDDEVGAGDQGIMFGYATDETPELFPATILYAQRLAKRLSDVRHNGTLPYLRPDGKTQVTMEYVKNADGSLTPTRVDTVVISAQHNEKVELDQLREDIKREVIDNVFTKESHLLVGTKFYINKYGKFVIGGPTGDAGLTGRKIIVDSYGGWGNHGGGAFSGKDYTKVDRSAAYACRQLAKSVVAEGWAHRCLVQVSYVIGGANPLSVYVDTYGSGKLPDEEIACVLSRVDMRPYSIAERLQLRNPIYAKTAAYGHFARDDVEFPWEKPLSLKNYMKAEEK